MTLLGARTLFRRSPLGAVVLLAFAAFRWMRARQDQQTRTSGI